MACPNRQGTYLLSDWPEASIAETKWQGQGRSATQPTQPPQKISSECLINSHTASPQTGMPGRVVAAHGPTRGSTMWPNYCAGVYFLKQPTQLAYTAHTTLVSFALLLSPVLCQHNTLYGSGSRCMLLHCYKQAAAQSTQYQLLKAPSVLISLGVEVCHGQGGGGSRGGHTIVSE